jgi:tungstate transport system substrate-binding protein
MLSMEPVFSILMQSPLSLRISRHLKIRTYNNTAYEKQYYKQGGSMSKKVMQFLLLVLCLAVFTSVSASAAEIICSSTTSTENSGLFGYILPMFEKKTGIKVKVVARGTGAAIEMGKRGDADVAFVHAKEQELKAVEEGFFVNRHDVMYNDFVLIGPNDDPAKIKGTKTVADAFKKISAGSLFVSRGDKSGTHTKELSIWKKAGVEPTGQKWYLEVGQGMEKTQRIADEKRAYTLTDRGTWLATKDKDKLEMVIVLEGDPVMFNQYGVMAVNPEKHKHVKIKEATEFINWLISKEGQQAIASFKDSNGNPLFIPNAK